MPRRDLPSKPATVDWRRVVEHACTRKVAHPTISVAVAALHHQTDRALTIYRCPFSDGTPHWHLGHTPSWRTVRRIAAAIRARAQDADAA